MPPGSGADPNNPGTREGQPADKPVSNRDGPPAGTQFLKPMDIKRLARVPYTTVIRWLTVGHPRAGILPSIDLAEAIRRANRRKAQ